MTTLTQFTIYDHPRDYPHGFVVRRWEISAEGMHSPEAWATDSLEAARALVPKGLVNVGRLAGDDPVIVETWT